MGDVDQSPMWRRIVNPHEVIKYKPKGLSAIVKGKYEYYHYMQDNFDDSGWGCAYRSFQTVWSWLVHQHYTTQPVPSHKEIQKCLCDIGDKPTTFIGSRQWIGSMELSFCLENMLGITSRVLTSKSGVDLAEHARALIYHFQQAGAPVMIGGGQLAHTILGVDYDVRLGKCEFLVLDPHYKGADDVEKVVAGKWCAWRPLTFWDNKAFYNLLLPINPVKKMTDDEKTAKEQEN